MNRINLDDLLIGDILLHQATKQKPHQKKISKQSGSPYTHASIYIGDDLVFESNIPKVRTRNLRSTLEKEGVIGVLRTPAVFTSDRAEKLLEFSQKILKNKTWYDLKGAFRYTKTRSDYIENQLDIISNGLATEVKANGFENRRYFCSALVVACYCVVGIIEESAYSAYPPDVNAPGDLLRDPTFGWVLGYIGIDDAGLSDDDPLRNGTLWQEQIGPNWWE